MILDGTPLEVHRANVWSESEMYVSCGTKCRSGKTYARLRGLRWIRPVSTVLRLLLANLRLRAWLLPCTYPAWTASSIERQTP